MSESLSTFEQLKTWIGGLQPAPSPQVRDIGFVDAARSIALSRDPTGCVELLLVGERLAASRPAVERWMSFHPEWQSSNEGSFPANHVTFPPDAYFDSAAALVCVELVEAGYHDDPQGAFASVEPLVERFINGAGHVGDRTLIGLFGELTLLKALLARVDSARCQEVMDSWFGWRPSSRDFQIGSIGVEVKATTRSTSTHRIQGIHQIEVGYPVTDEAEKSLYLLSVGVLTVPEGQDSGTCLPELVEDILVRIPSAIERESFLARVQQYGGDAALGYVHARDQDKARFKQRFALAFERLFDVADNDIHVLKRADLAPFDHIDVESLEFTVDLPFPFKGEANPISGLSLIVDVLLQVGMGVSRSNRMLR